jgi:hypothetical protein
MSQEESVISLSKGQWRKKSISKLSFKWIRSSIDNKNIGTMYKYTMTPFYNTTLTQIDLEIGTRGTIGSV